jgi:prepilin-type processing-associated H-X9-DG protein
MKRHSFGISFVASANGLFTDFHVAGQKKSISQDLAFD